MWFYTFVRTKNKYHRNGNKEERHCEKPPAGPGVYFCIKCDRAYKPGSVIDSHLYWLEYYADKTYELSDEEYFGYAELAGKVE